MINKMIYKKELLGEDAAMDIAIALFTARADKKMSLDEIARLTSIPKDEIDAPEKRQKCQDKKGNEYACGLDATAKLSKLIGKKRITCIHHTSDKYGRFVFQCKNAQGIDVNQAMVQSGMAVSEYGEEYQKDEETAKENKIGIWSGNFIRPNLWRKGKR